jgi:tetratricopeptide (TPR) repeat protein
MALVGLGEACLDAGDPQAARPNLERSLDLFRKQGNKAGEGFALYNLGYAAHESGDPEEAQAWFLDSLSLREELGNRQSIAMCLFGLSEVASSKEQWERAATLLAAGQRLLTQTGTHLGVADEARYKRAEATTRAQLSEAPWDAAWADGAGMSVTEAVEYARSNG